MITTNELIKSYLMALVPAASIFILLAAFAPNRSFVIIAFVFLLLAVGAFVYLDGTSSQRSGVFNEWTVVLSGLAVLFVAPAQLLRRWKNLEMKSYLMLLGIFGLCFVSLPPLLAFFGAH